jgi:hypothetical protein
LNSDDFRAKQGNQLPGECRVNVVLPQGYLLNLLVSARSISHRGMLDIFLVVLLVILKQWSRRIKARGLIVGG